MLKGVILIITTIFVTISCGNRFSDEAGYPYRIATLKGPSAMGMIMMIDSLNSIDSPDVVVDIFDEPLQVRKMLIDGTADFAILPTTMASIIYNRGMDYRLAAIPVWGTLYLFGTDTTITRWDQLRNKRVHLMARGMTPDVLFRDLLKKNGVEPDRDVALDYSFPTHIDLANAVAAGRSQLGVISEPLVSLVMSRNSDVRPIFDLNREWNKIHGIPMAQTSFLVKGSIIENNPELIEEIMTAYEFSTRTVNRFPEKAAPLIVKYDILPDQSVALASIPRSNLDFVRAATIRDDVYDYLRVFYKMNPEIIGGKLPDEDFIY